MMEKMIPVTNKGKNTLFVLGVMIPPGETRHFPEWQLPPEHKPEAVADSPAAAEVKSTLAEISALSVAKLELGLPDLSDDELIALEELENAKEKPRQGALAAIVAERLRRAEVKTPGGLESTDESTDTTNNGGAGE